MATAPSKPDPAVDAYLNQVANQANSASPNWDWYLKQNPDVAAEAGKVVGKDPRFPNAEAYAQWHYGTYGQKEGRVAIPPTAYISTDGTKFDNPQAYRDYQTNYDANNTQTKLAEALKNANFNAQTQFKTLGLDPSKYQSYVDQQLHGIAGNIDPYDTNPSASFGTDTVNNILTGLTNTERRNDKGIVQNTFGTNYSQDALPSTTLNDTIQKFLSDNLGTAQTGLDRGLKRGQLNQVGYDAGENSLNQQKVAQTSKLNSTANDVLNKYRTQLDGVKNNALGAATGYNLGDNFNIGDYTTQAGTILDQAKQNAPGDFLNAEGTTPLFSLGDLISTAGQAQGSQNLHNLDVLGALDQKNKTDSAGRGLGSQGGF